MTEVHDVRFRSYEPRDSLAVKGLNVAALRSIYPPYRNGPWNSDLDEIEARYLNGGDFIVGTLDSTVVAMGALRRVSDAVVEIKRVGVDPNYQGRGIGRALLAVMEARAAELGFDTIVLDTTEKQLVAQHLYEKHGHVENDRQPVIYSPEVTLETIFYTKALVPLVSADVSRS
jgi:ribosomal protein S18 acetylase RimI-like enzyme